MQANAKRNYLTYVHAIIMFVIMFGVGTLPTFGQVTPLGMKILGVFLGTMYGWIFIDLLWPSLIGLVVLGLTEYTTIGEAFASALSTAKITYTAEKIINGAYSILPPTGI